MSLASIKAGRAFYEIFAEDKTGEGLSQAEMRLQKFGVKIGTIGASMTAFAAAGIGSLLGMVKAFADIGDVLGDAMGETGLSGEFLQALKFGAADVGVSFEMLRGGVSKLNKTLAEAARGEKGASDRLARLGLSINALLAMSPDERFMAVADAIAALPDPAQRSAAAIDLLGRSGARLLPMLAGGAKGLGELFDRLKSKGLILSEADIELAGRADGAFLLFSATLKQIAALIGAAVAPAFIEIMKVIQGATEEVARFINNNRGLVTVLAVSLAVIGAVGITLMAVGAAAIFASLASTGLAMAMGALSAVVAFLSSPLFLIAAAITACGVAAITSAYYLDQLFNKGQGFEFMAGAVEHVNMQLNVLLASLTSGKWELAFEFIAASFEQAFAGAILRVMEGIKSVFELAGRDFDISGFQDRAIKSSIRVGEIVAKIATESATGSKLRLPGARLTFNAAANGFQDSILLGGGFLSAAAVGRINQAAPANVWQDKMLAETEEQTDLLKEVRDNLGRLESLTVE